MRFAMRTGQRLRTRTPAMEITRRYKDQALRLTVVLQGARVVDLTCIRVTRWYSPSLGDVREPADLVLPAATTQKSDDLMTTATTAPETSANHS